MKSYFVYIVASKTGTLYVGITDNLERRIYEHKKKLIPGFTSKYNVDRLMFYQEFSKPQEAIEMEKKIKGWTRQKKINLIKLLNSDVKDLADSLT